jgi:hypothetical protein
MTREYRSARRQSKPVPVQGEMSVAVRYEALWPRSPRQVGVKPLARRLDTLEGKTVAQLWDYVFRGDEVFPLLEEGLKQRFPGVRFVSWKEFGSTHGSEEREVLASLPRRFKELGVDAVISGMGC